MQDIEIVVRVKLPKGKTQEDREFKDAIFAAKPLGFEIKWLYGNAEKWTKDKNGFTYIPMYLTDNKIAVAYWMERFFEADKKYRKLTETIKGLL